MRRYERPARRPVGWFLVLVYVLAGYAAVSLVVGLLATLAA